MFLLVPAHPGSPGQRPYVALVLCLLDIFPLYACVVVRFF